ncbi:hypothetical protein B296_00024240, partial [Ensete ventricosum]
HFPDTPNSNAWRGGIQPTVARKSRSARGETSRRPSANVSLQKGHRQTLRPSRKVGTELGRTIPSYGCCPRRDLYISNDGRASVVENLTHFKPSKILHIIWRKCYDLYR